MILETFPKLLAGALAITNDMLGHKFEVALLLHDLDEFLLANFTHRALVGCLGAFVNVTAYGTTPFLCHNLLLFNVCDCILFVVQR